jgi:hypothetical protein
MTFQWVYSCAVALVLPGALPWQDSIRKIVSSPRLVKVENPTQEHRMAGKKFLHPVAKVAVCAAGMLIMAYFLVPSFLDGSFGDRTDVVRLLVFLGFTYLLVRSIMDLISKERP